MSPHPPVNRFPVIRFTASLEPCLSPLSRSFLRLERLISLSLGATVALGTLTCAFADVSQVDFTDLPSGSGVRVTFHASQTLPHKVLKADSRQLVLEIDDKTPVSTLRTRFRKTTRVKNVMIERAGHRITLTVQGQDLADPLVGFALPPLAHPQRFVSHEFIPAAEPVTQIATPAVVAPARLNLKPMATVTSPQPVVKPPAQITSSPSVSQMTPLNLSASNLSPSDASAFRQAPQTLSETPVTTQQAPQPFNWRNLMNLSGLRSAFETARQQKQLMPILMMALGCLVGMGCLTGLIALKLLKKPVNAFETPEDATLEANGSRQNFSQALSQSQARRSKSSLPEAPMPQLPNAVSSPENRSLLSKLSKAPQTPPVVRTALASYHQQANAPISRGNSTARPPIQDLLRTAKSPTSGVRPQGLPSAKSSGLKASSMVSPVKSPVGNSHKSAPPLNTDVRAFLQSVAQQMEGQGNQAVSRALQNQLNPGRS